MLDDWPEGSVSGRDALQLDRPVTVEAVRGKVTEPPFLVCSLRLPQPVPLEVGPYLILMTFAPNGDSGEVTFQRWNRLPERYWGEPGQELLATLGPYECASQRLSAPPEGVSPCRPAPGPRPKDRSGSTS